MKKYSKIVALMIVVIIFVLITILHYKNKIINNQPEKSNLVKSIEGRQYDQEYRE